MLRITCAVLAASLGVSACANLGSPRPTSRDGAADVQAFADELQGALEMHAWQQLLADSDPAHFRTQVVELGISEPQYLADLLGLNLADNNIQEGPSLDWEDLERIESAVFEGVDESDALARALTGTVTLLTGETLQLKTWVSIVQGRHVLSSNVGQPRPD